MIYDFNRDGFDNLGCLLERMNEINSDWSITGGANLFIRGFVNYLNDVDVLTTKEGVIEISNIFCNDHVPLGKTVCENIKSYYFSFIYKGIKVEVMGDPENLVNSNWVKNFEWAESIEKYGFKDISFNVQSVSYELKIYILLGNKEKEKLICENWL